MAFNNFPTLLKLNRCYKAQLKCIEKHLSIEMTFICYETGTVQEV